MKWKKENVTRNNSKGKKRLKRIKKEMKWREKKMHRTHSMAWAQQ